MKLDKDKLILTVILGTLLLAVLGEMGRAVYTSHVAKTQKKPRFTIVVDPGHGGNDPGKVGVGDVKEKDINLQIAGYLQKVLEQNGCQVIMTRTQDQGLYQESDTNKKTADLQKRCERMDSSHADVAISIHQNSFPQPNVSGAQVFYQQTSQEGKKLADLLQSELIRRVDPKNHRIAKANNDYYLLKNTKCICTIVECGFLSNPQEAAKLSQSACQKQIAWAIAMGTLQYLEEKRGIGHEDKDTENRSGEFQR